MPKKKMTINDLARMVKIGFDETATKQELKTLREGMATKQEVRTGFQALADVVDIVRQDVHDIKIVLGPLVAQCQ